MEWRPRDRVSKWWWDQVGIDLVGEQDVARQLEMRRGWKTARRRVTDLEGTNTATK